jgi:hypothetical protein
MKNQETQKLSASQKVQNTIQVLTAKGRDELSGYELQRLISAMWKQEEKSLRYVYNQLKAAYTNEKANDVDKLVQQMTGAKFPTFASFEKAYTLKHFSRWGGLSVLRGINPNYQRAQKVKRQNKAAQK